MIAKRSMIYKGVLYRRGQWVPMDEPPQPEPQPEPQPVEPEPEPEPEIEPAELPKL